MGLKDAINALMGKGRDGCSHGAAIQEVTPSHPDGCPQCIEKGDTWVHLRVCLTCGQVGCCDNSPNKHATAHYHRVGHPVIQSYQPGEVWRWCYADELDLDSAETPYR